MTWDRQKGLLEDMMVKILQTSKKPMTLYEIIEVIKTTHPEAIRGKTPNKSLYSIIYKHEKKRKDRNEDLLFNVESKGKCSMYSLRKRP